MSVAAYADTIEEARRHATAGHLEEAVAVVRARAEGVPPADHDRLLLFAARLCLGQNNPALAKTALAEVNRSTEEGVVNERTRLKALAEK